MLQLLLVVLIVLLGSAICSATEISLLSIAPLRVRQLAESKQPAALALLAIREKINRPIATIVILNNVFNIVGSVIIGRMAASIFGDVGLGIFSGILTFLIIIFGEIVPKTLGERYAENLALFVALPVTGLTVVLTPLVWLMEKGTAPFITGTRQPATNEAEIQFLTQIGYQEGVIEDDEALMIQRVFQLNDMTALDVMTPRVAMTYLPGDSTLEECQTDIINSQHTRIVVVEDSIDQVIGIGLKHELLTALIQGKGSQQMSTLTRPVQFVPEVIRADKLLKVFQEGHEHLVIVVDEYGGVSGVVTLEDVLEVLTGEIVDETDRAIDLQEMARNKLRRLLQGQLYPPEPPRLP